jgi:hypothetical protein
MGRIPAPTANRSGGSSASTRSRMASAVALGSPGSSLDNTRRFASEDRHSVHPGCDLHYLLHLDFSVLDNVERTTAIPAFTHTDHAPVDAPHPDPVRRWKAHPMVRPPTSPPLGSSRFGQHQRVAPAASAASPAAPGSTGWMPEGRPPQTARTRRNAHSPPP